jgi:hypothetical protein
VGWNTIACPKQCGGLSVQPVREANISLLGKLVWDMVQFFTRVRFGLTFSLANISLGQISSSLATILVTLQLDLLLFEQKRSSKMVSFGVQV